MLDLEWLFQLISAVNEDYDRDRERTDRTITLMIRENEQLNLRLQATISKLAIQTARFAAALENMSHGLCMSDRHDRLVVANGRFAEILSWPADVA